MCTIRHVASGRGEGQGEGAILFFKTFFVKITASNQKIILNKMPPPTFDGLLKIPCFMDQNSYHPSPTHSTPPPLSGIRILKIGLFKKKKILIVNIWGRSALPFKILDFDDLTTPHQKPGSGWHRLYR